MKKILIASFALMTFFSCDEQKRVITPFVPEGNKIVLLEEFTGKGCTNCPKGSREIENLLTQLPNNLVAVSIHAGFFANPEFFPLGLYDLRTEDGEFLYNYIGAPLGYPSGSVNRTPVNGDIQLSLNQWASAITQHLQEEPVVDISVTSGYDVDTRVLTIQTSAIGKENVTGDIRLSVMLTESGIVDAQDDFEAGGIVNDYVHRHVLRDMLTPAAGESVATNMSIGQIVNRTYTMTIPDTWSPAHMEVIAFVSQVNGNSFPILQAVQAHVTE